MTNRPARVAGWVLRRIGRVVWISTMIVVPLFGFWLASSLAAYHNATQWLSLLVGLALFPLVPVGWDLIFVWRRSKNPRPAILTRVDRLVLRTLIVNGLFLGVMLWARPHAAFRAIAVRGDWMLDGYDGPIAQDIRGGILWLADAFEHRWHQAEHTYGSSDTAPTPEPPKPKPPAPPPPPGQTPPVKTPMAWPPDPAIDPAVKDMPEDVQTSVDAVGKYLAARITEPRRLVKALHDYVDLRLTYDHHTADLIMARDFANVPSQEADAVFAAKTGVCAGYAKLLAALGKSAGIEIAYITGYARDSKAIGAENGDAALLASLSGYAHAWNAAHVDDEWLLIDATWDDPEDAAQPIRTTFLFTPPELFVSQHLPDQEEWQLLDKRLSPGDFVRQPLITPRAGALGVALVEPTRSQVTVDGEVAITIDNPRHALIAADVRADGDHEHSTNCVDRPVSDAKATITCKVGSGQYEVRLYALPAGDPNEAMSLEYFGSIQVNGR